MKKIAFAGTFDPITNGHLWVIKEGLNIADHVYVMIAYNNTKKTLFTDIQRKENIELTLQENGISDRVSVIIIQNEYVAQSALYYGCDYLIRGIRSASDFDYESLIQKTNTHVLAGAKTLFVMPPRELESVSSSFVKSLVGPVGWHWNIKEFIPSAVYQCWLQQFITERCDVFLNSVIWNLDNKARLLTDVFNHYNSREYHNLEHIAHCLQELEWLCLHQKLDIQQIENLALGLLCHDIILYSENDTLSDEEQSAQWFEAFAKSIYFCSKNTEIIANMIRKTAYLSNQNSPITLTEKIMCSIDLAILAQPRKIYQWYTQAVRKEYLSVSDSDFIQGRIKALEKLLQQPVLYTSDYFSYYENRARENMQQELFSLR